MKFLKPANGPKNAFFERFLWSLKLKNRFLAALCNFSNFKIFTENQPEVIIYSSKNREGKVINCIIFVKKKRSAQKLPNPSKVSFCFVKCALDAGKALFSCHT